MALQRAKLADPVSLTPSAAPVYTNPAGTKSFIRGFVLFNREAVSTITVKLYWVPGSGGSAGAADDTYQWYEADLNPKASNIIELPYCFTLTEEGDSIQAEANGGATLILLGDKE